VFPNENRTMKISANGGVLQINCPAHADGSLN